MCVVGSSPPRPVSPFVSRMPSFASSCVSMKPLLEYLSNPSSSARNGSGLNLFLSPRCPHRLPFVPRRELRSRPTTVQFPMQREETLGELLPRQAANFGGRHRLRRRPSFERSEMYSPPSASRCLVRTYGHANVFEKRLEFTLLQETVAVRGRFDRSHVPFPHGSDPAGWDRPLARPNAFRSPSQSYRKAFSLWR